LGIPAPALSSSFLIRAVVFYFMEMNTRIQVEHPVTEMVTLADIVPKSDPNRRGEALGYAQDDMLIRRACN
jgi:acetyl/propionyl-CoA carboxylase alpha subunit